jgi:DNA-binding winged helix-turn-helix (wHTH) protein/tetratricopeptide (TPR) repeat protein
VRPSLGRLTGPAGEVQLEPRAMEVLVYLAEHAEEVASRREILDAVWRQEFVSDATLSGTIAKLRRAFGDDARNPRYIETLAKRGYRLLVRPTEALEISHRSGGSFESRASAEASSGGGRRPAAAVALARPSATVTSFPEVRARPDRPVFVKREAELERLGHLLSQTLAGEGRIAFVTGEAGTGKTALIEEMVRRAGNEHENLAVAVGLCSSQTGAGDAYAPWRQLLALLTGDVESGLASGSMLAGLGRRLWRAAPIAAEAVTASGRDLVGTVIPGASLLARARAAAPAEASWLPELRDLVKRKASLPPDAALQQAAVFMQVTRVLAAVARRQPLLLVLEDLQWADAGSIAMLFHLGREVASHRILILGSYRPTDVALGRGSERHPLEAAVAELRGRQSRLMIELGEAGDRAFVDALIDSEANRLGEDFRERLYRQTAGHALFTVETLRSLQERDMIVRDSEGRWVASDDLDWNALPERVEGVIGARVERLAEPLRELLAVAGVEGETFTAEVVARVQNEDTRATIRRLSRELDARHRLVKARGVRALDGGRLSMFGFSHVLFQRYLYSSLNEVERVQLHHDVGTALEALHGDDTEEVAVRLSHHFEQAGVVDRAIHYLHQAGTLATRMAAYQEAVGHLTKALELLATLPESDDRDRTELDLLLAIQVPEMAIKGWGNADIARELERANELAERVGDDSQKGWVLYLDGILRVNGGRLPESEEVGRRLEMLASRLDNDVFRLFSHFFKGYCWAYTGRCEEGRAEFEQVLEQFDRGKHHWVSHVAGLDHEVMTAGHLSWLLARMGHLDQAIEWVERCREFSGQAGYSMGSCMPPAMGFYCRFHRHELGPAARFAEQALAVATEHGFVPWAMWARTWLAMVLVARAEFADGVAGIERELPGLRIIGLEFGRIIHQCSLAEGQLGCGRVEVALSTLDEALRELEVHGERFWEPEVHRLRGQAFRTAGATTEAESCYQRAIQVAREQGARLFELQAATNLARMWQGQGRRDEARELLAPIYGWFTEGLDTAPLIEARALLDELDQNE